MRKIDDGEKEKRKKKKITVEIVATNVVASRPPNCDRLQSQPLMPIIGNIAGYVNEILEVEHF